MEIKLKGENKMNKKEKKEFLEKRYSYIPNCKYKKKYRKNMINFLIKSECCYWDGSYWD